MTVGVAEEFGNEVTGFLAAGLGEPLKAGGVLAFDADKDPHSGVGVAFVRLEGAWCLAPHAGVR